MIVDHTTTGLLTSTLKTLHRADAGAANHLEETGRLMSVGKLDGTNARDLLTAKQVTKKRDKKWSAQLKSRALRLLVKKKARKTDVGNKHQRALTINPKAVR